MTGNVARLFWQRGLPVVGVVALLGQLFWWAPHRVSGGRLQLSDADAYYQAARRAAAGQQVYATDTRTSSIVPPNGFLYPPSALALLKPAAKLSSQTWRATFCLIAIASIWALAAALVRIATGKTAARHVLAVGALLAAFPPARACMSNGNLDIVVVALTAWAFAEPRVSAALLVIAASIKLYPGFVVAAWWPRTIRSFRLQAEITAGIIVLLALMTAGPYMREWLRLGLPSLNNPTTAYGNWSISTLFLCDSDQYDLATVPRTLRLALSLAPIVAAVVAYTVTRKRSMRVTGIAVLMVGMWAAAICWWSHLLLVATIPASMWIARRRSELQQAPRGERGGERGARDFSAGELLGGGGTRGLLRSRAVNSLAPPPHRGCRSR